jgi:hypothetical protein
MSQYDTVAPRGVQPSKPDVSAGRTLDSLLWALALPAVLLLGAALTQWVTVVGVVVVLAAVAAGGIVVGGSWHRAGAAVLVCSGGFALTLFAGPAVYEVYMRTVGDPVPAVVVEVVDRDVKHGADMACTVRELGGERRTFEVSQRQNCFGQAKEGDRVVMREDPLGLLDPWLPRSPDEQHTTDITLACTAGLTVLVAGATFYGGQRRRRG